MIEIETSKYSTILFDFDGTLVDTEHLHYDSYKLALKKIGIEYYSFEDHVRSNIGHNSEEILKHELHTHGRTDIGLDELVLMKRFIFTQKLNEGVSAMTGALELLYKIKQKGLKLAIISSGKYEVIQKIMLKAGIPNFFDLIVTKELFERLKPDPQCYEKALSILGLEPKSCITFENDLTGIEAATKAGIQAIAVVKYKFYDEINKKYPNINIISDFTEITLK